MTHTVPEDDFTAVEGLRIVVNIPDGVPGGHSTYPSRLDFLMDTHDGEDAPWRGNEQYVTDLFTEALDALVAKVATDYPLADPATYSFQVFKSKGY